MKDDDENEKVPFGNTELGCMLGYSLMLAVFGTLLIIFFKL